MIHTKSHPCKFIVRHINLTHTERNEDYAITRCVWCGYMIDCINYAVGRKMFKDRKAPEDL